MNIPFCFECRIARGGGTCWDCTKFREWCRAEKLLDANTREHPEIISVQWRAAIDDMLFKEYLDGALGMVDQADSRVEGAEGRAAALRAGD